VSARTSPRRRALAARVLRETGNVTAAAKAARVNRRTVYDWLADESFLTQVHGRGVLQAGPLRVSADPDEVLHDLPADESWLWVAAGPARAEVLGSLLVADASQVRVAFIPPERQDEVRAELEAHRFPLLRGCEPTSVLVPTALAALRDADNLALLTSICSAPPAEALRAFLSLWRFRAQETRDVRTLDAENLWPAQEIFVSEITAHPHVYALKARKLGQSTIATAYAGYVARFRDPNARVHLYSRSERAALELLAAVRFGLDNLPSWLQLPTKRATLKSIEYDAGPTDRRLVVAYPTTDAVAVEATATHSQIDEWSDMPRPDVVYQALEPTFSAQGCTSLILTTGNGPASPASDYWRRCLDGDALHHPVFLKADLRPDRDEAWFAAKRREMLPSQFATEYPMHWRDALAGTSKLLFSDALIDHAGIDTRYTSNPRPGFQFPIGQAQPRRRYVVGWDIGSAQDASVGVVLDVTESPMHDLADVVRLVKADYPTIQHAIENTAKRFPGSLCVIESNAMGAAVLQNLTIAAEGFTTTAASKARILQQVALELQMQQLKWDLRAFRQLTDEMRAYTLPDDHVTQDCVIALALAVEHAAHAHLQQGRLLGVIHF
jgi:Terminase RNaseH-like domain